LTGIGAQLHQLQCPFVWKSHGRHHGRPIDTPGNLALWLVGVNAQSPNNFFQDRPRGSIKAFPCVEVILDLNLGDSFGYIAHCSCIKRLGHWSAAKGLNA
jgi:hypothetical protein